MSARAVPRAFTLIELVMVVAIAAIMFSIAGPRFGNSIALRRVDGVARRMEADLELARRHAMTASVSQKVLFDAGPPATYVLSGLPHPDRPAQEYIVTLSEELGGATLVSADFGGDREVVYDMYGVPDSGGAAVIRVGGHDRTIAVDANTGWASITE